MIRYFLVAVALCWHFTAFAAAYTYVATGTVDTNTDGSALSPGAPAGAANDDLLLIYTGQREDAASVTITGWTEIESQTANASLKLFCRIKDGDAADTPSVDWSGTSDTFAWIEAYTGDVFSDCSTIVAHSATDGGTGTTCRLPAVSGVTTDDTMAIAFCRKNRNVADVTDVTNTPEFTERTEILGPAGGHISASGSWQQTTATDYDGDDWTVDGTASSVTGNGLIVYLKTAAAAAPAFTAGPTASSLDSLGFNIDATADANSTLHCVAVHPVEPAPSIAQVKAGQNNAGGSAIESPVDVSLTADVSGTMHFTGLGTPLMVFDVHCVVSNASGDSAVSSIADQERGVRTGFDIFQLTSISGTSPYADNTYFDPDMSANDWVEVQTATNEDAFVITHQADGDFSYPDTCNGCRQSFEFCPYDQSAGASFTTPTCDDTIWVNNEAPGADPFGDLVLDLDVAMTAIDICAQFTDAEGDTLTNAVQSGTLPTGLSIGGTGNCTLSGTPTVENESGAAMTFRATDVPGDTGDMTMTIYPIDTITMPTLTDSDLDAAIADVISAFPWKSDSPLTATILCNTGDVDDVSAQSPAASTEVEHDVAITVDVSKLCDVGKALKLKFGLGL